MTPGSNVQHFTYAYRIRMRPNSKPKPRYEGMLIMDADAPFAASVYQIQFDGREDESELILKSYGLKVAGDAKAGSAPVAPGHVFHEGEVVRLELSRRTADAIPKLRKRADGGRGINVDVMLVGFKSYPVA